MNKIFNFKESLILSLISVSISAVYILFKTKPPFGLIEWFFLLPLLFTFTYFIMLVLNLLVFCLKSLYKFFNPVKIFCKTEIGYRIKILWLKIQKLRGKQLDESVIPKGLYCYSVTEEELKRVHSPDWNGTYNITPCPYFGCMRDHKAACFYMGFIGWDPCLWDQCKICGKNYPNAEN